MDVCTDIEQSFKDLLKLQSYETITVTDICKTTKISRTTFYAHFDSKEAIVDSLFDEHVTKPLRELRILLPHKDRRSISNRFNVQMYERLLAEREYYTNLVSPMRGNDDTFLRVATNAIYDFNMNIVLPQVRSLSSWQLDYTAYFFASSQAMYMQKWISEGMEVSPDELSALYSRFTMQFWESLKK